MNLNKPKSLRIASDESAARVIRFHEALRALCAAHDIEIDPDGRDLQINDLRRSTSSGWPWVASISEDGELEFDEIDEADFPEDFAELAAAKKKGEIW